jgi:sugar phosphate isomerase/epimerase
MKTNTSRVGFSTGNVNGNLNELARRLEFFKANGSDLAELTAVGLDVVSNCRLIDRRMDELRMILDAHDFEYTIHAPIACNLLDRAHLALHFATACASIDLAQAIGATVVVIHPGRAKKEAWEQREQELLELELSSMRQVGLYAAERNIIVAFENLSPNTHHFSGQAISYALDPTRLALMLEEVNLPSVTACLDISHAQQGAKLLGLDVNAGIAALAPYVSHIHFSDSTGTPSDIIWDNNGERLFMGIGDMHAPPGWGEINFDDMSDALSANRPQGRLSIAIELRSNHIPYCAEETLIAAKSFADKIAGVRHASTSEYRN